MTVTLANSSATRDWRNRPATDFFPTPANVTQALIDYLEIEKAARIWECAAGEGHMVRALESNGYETIATDIATGTDFLLETESRDADWIITNPPFIASEAFIRHAAGLPVDGFAFLLKSQYWHAAQRSTLFCEIAPSMVLPLTWRPDFLFGAKSKSPTMEVLWTVWIRDWDAPTLYQPLSKPRCLEAELSFEPGSNGSTNRSSKIVGRKEE